MVQLAQDKEKRAQPSMPKIPGQGDKAAGDKRQKKETPHQSLERQMKEVTAQEEKLYTDFKAIKAQLKKDGRGEVLTTLGQYNSLKTSENLRDGIVGTLTSREKLKDVEEDNQQRNGLIEKLSSQTLDIARQAQTLNESLSGLSDEDRSAYTRLLDMQQKMEAASLYRLHLLSEKAEAKTEEAKNGARPQTQE